MTLAKISSQNSRITIHCVLVPNFFQSGYGQFLSYSFRFFILYFTFWRFLPLIGRNPFLGWDRGIVYYRFRTRLMFMPFNAKLFCPEAIKFSNWIIRFFDYLPHRGIILKFWLLKVYSFDSFKGTLHWWSFHFFIMIDFLTICHKLSMLN